MSLIETLNANADKTPDQIVKAINDPLKNFVRIKEITAEQLEAIRGRRVFFAREDGSRWDGGGDTPRISPSIFDIEYIRNVGQGCYHDWAIIGAEYAAEADLEWLRTSYRP